MIQLTVSLAQDSNSIRRATPINTPSGNWCDGVTTAKRVTLLLLAGGNGQTFVVDRNVNRLGSRLGKRLGHAGIGRLLDPDAIANVQQYEVRVVDGYVWVAGLGG